jgi:hypothetical protein
MAARRREAFALVAEADATGTSQARMCCAIFWSATPHALC